jgi:hypothetical protein
MNRYDLGRLAVAITSYLASEHFAGLAPTTQRTRRSLLRTVFAHAENEVGGPSETPVDLPPPDPPRPARSAPWHPAHQRRNWRTA